MEIAVYTQKDTQEISGLGEPTAPTGGEVAVGDELNKKEVPLEGNKQDDLPVPSDGDRSKECNDPLSGSQASTETSDKDIQHPVVNQSDSNLNTTESNHLVTSTESEHLHDPQVPSVSNKDDGFSFDLPNTSDGNSNKVLQAFSTPQESVRQDEGKSTGRDDHLSGSQACTESSDKVIRHPVVNQSDSNLSSAGANCLVSNKESKHLHDAQVPSVSNKDDVISLDLPKTSDGNTDKVSQPSSTPQASVIYGTVVEPPVASSPASKSKKRSQKISQGVKESSEPKRRRSTARKGGKKGNQPDEATPSKQLDREEGPANSQTPIGSDFPTLSFSTSLPTAFQQPFTDLQQLQLRAQIFVYGSLIQGNAPEEACLISAFGGPDGGRRIWEKPWRKCIARIHNQVTVTNVKSPVIQSSGKSTPDQTSKRKRNASPLGSAGKSNSSHTLNPIIPLSSPLWNMHTSAPDGLPVSVSQAPAAEHSPLPPLYPLHTPTKNMGHATQWSSHASLPVPWVAPAQNSTWNPKSSSTLSSVEPVQLIPMKDSPVIPYSTANYPSTPSLSTIAASAISTDMVGANPTLKYTGQIPKDLKSKKQKKVSASDARRPDSHSNDQVLATPINSIQIASVEAAPLPAANVTSSATPLLPSNCILLKDKNADRKDMTSDDTLHRVNDAKLHAEEASACAEAAVSHSQHIWGQLDKQKNSRLAVDHESKVASAAVAIAAAASVAKAAAAAAKLAFEAALQAKLMFEESFVSSECVKVGSVDGVPLSDSANILSEVTPASILKGENKANNSTSVICAAKEAARRKIETALAASKHAENVDAIVKAAELAAEAVAQASRVVAMGDPLPLSELVVSRPEGYHKYSQGRSEQLVTSNSDKGVSVSNEANDGKVIVYDERLDSEPSQHTKSLRSENQHAQEIVALETIDAPMSTASLASAPLTNEDLAANAMVHPEFVSEMKPPSESGKTVETSVDNHIEEGSIVEVFKEWGTVKAAWFAAKVLELKDEEICVQYLQNQFSDGQYKEWITLSSEDNSTPIVRVAHPMTVVPLDGVRKRRRSAVGNCSWEVGDKVDACMQDCWWEGIIIEKNNKDESLLTVQFPVQGETCVIKACNLRPSLIWKDKAWVQWSNSNDRVRPHRENDTPRGKRQKLSSPKIEIKGKDKASESSGNASLRAHEQSELMGLSENEKKFNVGKNNRDDSKVNPQRMVRTGLREGSKVIFGVPKPGKKKKFMDVSNPNDAQKPSRIPISRGPHGWKNSKSRTEALQKTSKPKPKDASGTSAASEVDKDKEIDHTAVSGSASGTDRHAEHDYSDGDETIDDSILISSLARPSSDHLSKKSALGKMKSEKIILGKNRLPHAKPASIEGDKAVVSRTTQQEALDSAERRRSNRRIQPTSRLLEGLQTSLSIARVSSTVNRK